MYKVIENWLPREINDNIKDIMSFDNFPWFYHDYVATRHKKSGDEFYFTHTFYDAPLLGKEINSGFWDNIVVPILYIIGQELPLIRVKANLFTKRDRQIAYGFHQDYKATSYPEHTTFVLSLNTNNGYTEFEDGTKIPSIERQMLIFDGNVKHRSVGQTDTLTRINMNINIEGNYKNFI